MSAIMKRLFFVTVLFLYILQLNEATQMNIDVTLHRKDIVSLFTHDEIYGTQYLNNTQDILKLNVVIQESKLDSIKKVAIAINIIWADINVAIRKEREEIDNTPKWNSTQLPDIFFLQYRDWPQYEEFLASLLLRHPNVASQSSMGETVQGREIPVITLSAPNGGANKPGFYIQAALHAREWLANSATTWILNALAEGYDNGDDRIVTILNAINIYIVPTVNIDGYIYSWTNGNRNWRKNRRNNGGNSFGVDLNRNYDGPTGTWGTSGTSHNPSSDTYCGPNPFSEPEVQAGSGFVSNPAHNIDAAFDMHTYGPLLLWPWGYTRDEADPPYRDYYFELGGSMQSTIAAVHGVQYTSIQSAELYPASGDSTDFAFTNGGATGTDRISFTFEGRGNSFAPSATNIIPAGQEQLAAVLQVAEMLF